MRVWYEGFAIRSLQSRKELNSKIARNVGVEPRCGDVELGMEVEERSSSMGNRRGHGARIC